MTETRTQELLAETATLKRLLQIEQHIGWHWHAAPQGCSLLVSGDREALLPFKTMCEQIGLTCVEQKPDDLRFLLNLVQSQRALLDTCEDAAREGGSLPQDALPAQKAREAVLLLEAGIREAISFLGYDRIHRAQAILESLLHSESTP